ncbi:bifunctional tRNA (5-methylaminomethyl-2-thiouridine)(34)-methyltransferase MnmD/FAD-dependent 5-carboxymethylaminomethyl-2-thiouridine(34) oxidoreductase MnmC [Thalassotalea profundi]|uniref:tRNA 5-methylaminomethyl-2-thiouridine biosynthesis bifunctional protein MnmC n=1 Tax=Thalassotalea profundi TaxID=2036687 RepID=A0ABQ3IJR8_9GAMM|nr:bifunctional tRNA (5-methylaminomethyl-2-thiouridine)(34)-methyltransferase MnmD/FAD-dependent 5-carboxymethylaminomethyl-2-thiouridine(34) oxidoreductase MnmC [Thalassotalea profundi]GHE85809.1 tRNA 5-methylaminomethyl-2-thiouridine biosynthesis bifunctional protein MnmC [Thalassotalea profundi]
MINNPNISFRADGSPYSEEFSDIYFDTESGYQQSSEVFIQGNNIQQKLLNSIGTFTIGETGFGTGLNFLLTLKLFISLYKQLPQTNLHFISAEITPLTREQIQRSLASFPTLSKEAALLLEHYPETFSPQCTIELLGGRVKLTLLFQDATSGFSQLHTTRNGLVDAWYLDGFSPAKNPQMWQVALFEQIARLSKPQASISTFTVAGHVRRKLIDAGFRLARKTYIGQKKEILIGIFQQGNNLGKAYQLRPKIVKPQFATIIGGGIASACAAYALTQQGVKVTLLCKDSTVAQGASSNKIGALFPLLHQQQDDISLFYHQAFEYAISFYHQLLENGYHFSHSWCGLLDIAYKDSLIKRQEIFSQNKAWPKSLIHSVNSQQASKLANLPLAYGGLFMPRAGWIAPAELVKQLFKAANDTNNLRIKNNIEVTELTQLDDKKWQINTNEGAIHAHVVILTGGAEAIPLNVNKTLPLTSVRGQISAMHSNVNIGKLSTVICHKGYLTPENKGLHCIGATFDKDSFDMQEKEIDDEYNLNMLNKCLPGLTDWQLNHVASSKARLRCMTPDHLPVVGAMPDIDAHKKTYAHLAKDKNWRFNTPAPCIDNLYTLTGLGARGLCTAPLLAEILAADLCGQPYPVDNQMLFNLAPNRFIIRDIIKRQVNV